MKTTLCNRLGVRLNKAIVKALALLVFGALLTGCPSKPEAPAQPPSSSPNKIIIKGSHTIGEELAPRLFAEFKKDHPTIEFEAESKGTGIGLVRLLTGECDIAGASRQPIQAEQEQAREAGVELKDYVLGSYSVAVVVNSANPITSLTKEQVHDIFTGAVKNWKDVGGPDAPIQLCIRDPISGTYLGFRELAMENKPYAPNPKTFTSYLAIAQNVAQDANAIGYSSLQLSATSGVKPVAIGGISPTAASVNDGKYPYARTIRYYTNKAKESPTAIEFIQFILSPRGQKILDETGFTPRS